MEIGFAQRAQRTQRGEVFAHLTPVVTPAKAGAQPYKRI